MIQGPNVKKLIAHRASMIIVPSGCGDGKHGALLHALGDITKTGRLVEVTREATRWVEAALLAVRQAAEPNSYKIMTDEEIAGVILAQIKERKGMKR